MGAPAHVLGFGIAQLVSTAAWPIAILASASLGAGWLGRAIGCGIHRPLQMCFQIGRHVYEHAIFGESRGGQPPQSHRVRVIIFRVVAALASLFFVVAVVLMASAPGVLLQPDHKVRTELVVGSSSLPGTDDRVSVMLTRAPGS